jgi:hypothetical protein
LHELRNAIFELMREPANRKASAGM